MCATRRLALLFSSILLGGSALLAQKFYPDDPLWKEPPPFPVNDPTYRSLNEIWELFENLTSEPGERHPKEGVIPAQGINTLGEVPDSGWYTNRHALHRMTPEQLLRGPANEDPPSRNGPWNVLTVKRFAVRPGLLIMDADKTAYLLRFDPPGHLELSTGASLVASRLFYALGYWVPENYIVYFDRSQLLAWPEGYDIDAVGGAQRLTEEDIDLFLKHVPKDRQRGYRAVASRIPNGKMLGPYQFYGTRSDDPNDVVSHEHRRDLRGLYVISSWMDYNWVRALNTADFLVEENGVPFIRHYLADFFTAFGSGFQRSKDAREGNEPFFDWNTSVRNFLGMGIYAPAWQRAKYPSIRAIGRFEYETFEPENWTPNLDLAPLENHLPDDDYWAAKRVMAFSDEDLRTIVRAAQYSDPRAEAWLAKCLIERRNKIGRVYFSKVLPLDNLHVDGAELKFDDLAVKYGFVALRRYAVAWSKFANFTQEYQEIQGATDFRLPREIASAKPGSYFAARINAGEYRKTVTVYLHMEAGGVRIVGIDRDWPGYTGRDQPHPLMKGRESHYVKLDPKQKALFDRYTESYNKKTGFGVKPEEYFSSLSVSERTTFEAVTHALMNTKLTGRDGKPLGTALELLSGIERVAGQYYGRQGDEQFRIYVSLREHALETIQNSQQFHRDKENTVFHIGYPLSYRQAGKEPTLQISMAEDGRQADIDVDYRSSKMPQAVWNGHLTSANSDVRAGKNLDRHNNRWSGLIAWWQALFGQVPEKESTAAPADLMAYRQPDKIIPLPPNRPAGAMIPRIDEAAQEFLADWLVRRNYDEAMEFISDEALPCLLLDLRGRGNREATRAVMREALEDLASTFDRKHQTLSGVIEGVKPWGPNLREVPHAFSHDFYLGEVSDVVGESFLCANRIGVGRVKQRPVQPASFGTFYGVIFRFRLPSAREGAFGILWKREDNRWKAISYDIIGQ